MDDPGVDETLLEVDLQARWDCRDESFAPVVIRYGRVVDARRAAAARSCGGRDAITPGADGANRKLTARSGSEREGGGRDPPGVDRAVGK
jgi:hypothetical protein